MKEGEEVTGPLAGPECPTTTTTTTRRAGRRKSKVGYRKAPIYSPRRAPPRESTRPVNNSAHKQLRAIQLQDTNKPPVGYVDDEQQNAPNQKGPSLHITEPNLIDENTWFTSGPTEHTDLDGSNIYGLSMPSLSFGTPDTSISSVQSMDLEDFMFPISETFGPSGSTDPMTGLAIPGKIIFNGSLYPRSEVYDH
jgi:hypothetical protein